MNDKIGSIGSLFLLLVVYAIVIPMVAGWKLLKQSRQWLGWLDKAAKPHLIEAWARWQPGQPEARKPDDIQRVGIEARDEIDRIMAYYRQHVDDILQTEGISPDTPPEIVLLSTHKHKIQEDTYVR